MKKQILFALMLTSVIAQYKIIPINNTVGIYYHEETYISISHSKWTLLVNKDIAVLREAFDNNNKILDSITTMLNQDNHGTKSFYSEVKTHVSLLLQTANLMKEKFSEVLLDTKRYKRGILNGIGSIFKAITGNLDSSDGEYYSDCINKLNNDEHQLENLLKNQISVTSSVIKNFNTTIQKIQIDEKTFNDDIQAIRNSLMEVYDEINLLKSKMKLYEICEKLMESYIFIEENLDDILDSITFARLNIIHASIITPEHLVTSLQQISQRLHKNVLPLPPQLSSISQYLEIIELQAFQIDNNIVFVLKIPLIEPQTYTLFRSYPIPIYDNRTGLHHILSISHKYIAKDDDSLMYLTIEEPSRCKQMTISLKLCENIFPYPIDTTSACEIRLLKNSQRIPENCQSTSIYGQGYNIQNLEENSWLVTVAEPLHVIITCPDRNPKTEIMYKNSILKMQLSCSAFVGVTKIQAFSRETLNVSYNTHPLLLPYDCCSDVPNQFHPPELKPLKISNINADDLEIAKHKLDQYSRDLDDLINEPFVSKHISWFTYVTIILVVGLILLYLFCKCRQRRRHLTAILPGDYPPYPPQGPTKPLRRFTRYLPNVLKKRPSIHEEEEEVELQGI